MITCPNCKKKYRSNPSNTGKRVKCQNCGTEFTSGEVESTDTGHSPSRQIQSSAENNLVQKIRRRFYGDFKGVPENAPSIVVSAFRLHHSIIYLLLFCWIPAYVLVALIGKNSISPLISALICLGGLALFMGVMKGGENALVKWNGPIGISVFAVCAVWVIGGVISCFLLIAIGANLQ